MKFFQQLAGDVYPSDAELWRKYQDAHDSAAVSFVAFRPAPGADSAARGQVTDAEIAQYYATYKKQLHSPTRAIVTALIISRRPTEADSAMTHTRILAVQKRISAGEKFEAVAKEVSDDTVSSKDGGKLPPSVKGAFVKEFEDVLAKLKPGQQSEPVRTQFGWHLIRLDERKGDTAIARHILLAFKQSDSSATKTDRIADELAKLAANSEDGKKLDAASKQLTIAPVSLDAVEGQRAIGPDGAPLAGLSQWATAGGAKVGEISELFDTDHAYFLARVDSIIPGGDAPLARVRDNIRLYLAQKKAILGRTDAAKAFAKAAVTTSFEAAAKAQNLKLESTPLVARFQFVPGLGQGNTAIGAAFGLTVGAVGEPVVAQDAVYVIRVDKRVNADKSAWQAQLAIQRLQVMDPMRQERVRGYLNALREEANVVDKRREVMAAGRGQSAKQ
jgi:peptidyl-prolyl cis-trans isomerase D